jgi:hypothetical protein
MQGWGGWPGLKTVCRVEREVWGRKPVKPGEQPSYEKETAYLISSLDLKRHTPQELLALNRGHWGIENKLHYVRDVTLGEDSCRARTGSAPQVLAGIRNSVIALARSDGWTNIAAALRHYGVKTAKALSLIGIRETAEN